MQAHQLWLSDAEAVTGYEHTGCSGSMFANRLSWTFDLRGPSKAIDTACSSSLTALVWRHGVMSAAALHQSRLSFMRAADVRSWLMQRHTCTASAETCQPSGVDAVVFRAVCSRLRRQQS